MTISWFLYSKLKNKTQCVGFFTITYKLKHNTDEAIPFARLQKSQHKNIISKKISELEKLSTIINRWEGVGGVEGGQECPGW